MKQVASVTDARSLLCAHGLRATPQRLAIAEHLFSRACHLTPQALYKELKGRFPSMSLNTVYMALAQFEEQGLLRRLFVDGRAIFDSNMAEHDHAYCKRCGRLMDLEQIKEEPPPASLSGWEVHGESRVWCGLCPACA